MPEHITQAEQAPPIIARQHIGVLVEVGDVIHLHGKAPVSDFGDIAGCGLKRAEMAAKGQLLFVIDVLAVEDQHTEAVHAGINGGGIGSADGVFQINAGNHADKIGPRRIGGGDGDAHWFLLCVMTTPFGAA